MTRNSVTPKRYVDYPLVCSVKIVSATGKYLCLDNRLKQLVFRCDLQIKMIYIFKKCIMRNNYNYNN